MPTAELKPITDRVALLTGGSRPWIAIEVPTPPGRTRVSASRPSVSKPKWWRSVGAASIYRIVENHPHPSSRWFAQWTEQINA
jgi:hypothetical protein